MRKNFSKVKLLIKLSTVTHADRKALVKVSADNLSIGSMTKQVYKP